MQWTFKLVWMSFGLSFGLALFICFAFSPPIPGVAIAALAVFAFVMTLVLPKAPSRGEKLLWMTGAFALMFVEILAITHDRQKQEANFRVMLTDVEDSIKTQTGGDSFAFITFTPEEANVQFNQFPASSSPYFLVSITSHGRYPLRGIRATMEDPERKLQAMREDLIHPQADFSKVAQAGDTHYEILYLRPQSAEAPNGDVQLLGTYPFGTKDANDLTIAFSGPNGYWDEVLHLRRFNGTWHQALSVVGPTAQQMQQPFIYVDPDFPQGRALAERDWPKPQAPPAAR
jgi:hypothetical protein